MTEPAYPDALPAHTRLHWYVMEKVLGQGGFGITYLARDTNLDQTVAVKEYLPVEVATRMVDATIRARTEELRDRYRWGLDRFIQEARTLARFDHRNIVRVQSVFEMNGTAYIVMRFETGVTLSGMLSRRGTLSEEELLRTILPILDGLELVHQAGFIHRDIKPDNIHIGSDGTPVLLDFGSARQALGTGHTLTILVAPGYAPFEQYYSDSVSQGPWTDIYGLGATCYRAIAGVAPLDAVSRSKGVLGSTRDVMVPAAIIGAGRYSSHVLAAIDHALAFGEKERPQSIAEWRKELIGERKVQAPVPAPETVAPDPAAVTTVAAPPPPMTPAPNKAAAFPAGLARAVDAVESGSRAGWRFPAVYGVGAALLASIGVAAYLVAQSSNETRSKLVGLQAQLQEKERALEKADATRESAERAAKQKADEDARMRQEQQQQARVPSDALQPDASPKRDAEASPKRNEQKQRDSAPSERIATPKPQSAPATPARTPSPAVPTIAPPSVAGNSPPPTVPSTADSPAASKTESSAPKASESPQPPPAPSPGEQLASAERAFAAGKSADAVATLQSLAESGHAEAQKRLGDAYAQGQGVARNVRTALQWYERAALQGDIAAQLKLGSLYAGAGSGQNNNLAYVWYGAAAKLGSSAATVERDRVGALLQPAERDQSDRLIETIVGPIRKTR